MNREDVNSRTDEFMRNIVYGTPIEDVRKATQSLLEIYVPKSLAENYECQCMVFTVINELVRLGDYCPPIRVHVQKGSVNAGVPLLPDGAVSDGIGLWIEGLPYEQRLVFEDYLEEHPSVRVCIRNATLNVACSGWSIQISQSDEPAWETTLPVIACIASSWLVNEIMKIILSPVVSGIPVPKDVRFNFVDFTVGTSSALSISYPINVRDATLVGVGGIGSAVVYALLLQRSVSGKIVLVDDDSVSSTNLNRLLYARSENCGDAKAELGRLLLEQYTQMRAEPKKETWAKYVHKHRNDIRLVLGAVDEDTIRQSIQSDLPQIYIDGGTGVNNWRVSRHNILDTGCIYCLTDSSASDAMVAGLRSVGILESALAYRIKTNTVFTSEDLMCVPESIQLHFLNNTPQVGWEQFRNSIHCGDASYAVGQHMSAPHLSSMPGFLMALELIKISLGKLAPPGNWNVILGNLNGTFHAKSAHKQKNSHCSFCSREDYRAGYQAKWS